MPNTVSAQPLFSNSVLRCAAAAVLVVLNAAAGAPEPSSSSADENAILRGRVLDASTNRLLPARIYARSLERDTWHFVRVENEVGSAVPYEKQRGESVEKHTTISAHAFQASLPPGQYAITVERGKEYIPDERIVELDPGGIEISIRLKRWINMAERGWYSGDTHVHRSLDELPNLLLAEDLNVALPLTKWVTTSHTPPSRGESSGRPLPPARLIQVDEAHAIYPLNTEYEIFSVRGRRHTLGAVFVLNHQTPLEAGVPPVEPIAQEARRQNALLDLDKHSWPWSLMLVPVMNVDLFELSNNHLWRVPFHYRQWTIDAVPKEWDIELTEDGFTERGWIDFGLQTYYALLNCGFRLRPSAGTASGVHPVPLGFGRVYVYLGERFDYDEWIEGLDRGRSFVTTGPMLLVQFNGKRPGHVFERSGESAPSCRVTGTAESPYPLERIEVIVNGLAAESLVPQNERTDRGSYVSELRSTVELDGSSWVAVRCFARTPEGRVRFAHSAPVHFEVAGRPLRPRRDQVQYFIERMQEEILRDGDVLDEASLREYQRALTRYRNIARHAR